MARRQPLRQERRNVPTTGASFAPRVSSTSPTIASVYSVTSASRRFFAALLATLLAACSGDSPSARGATPSTGNAKRPPAHKIDDSAAGNVDLGSGKYRANYALGATGSLRGTIKLESPSPADTSAAAAARMCGSKGATPAREKPGVLVWIVGISTGKPLPIEKRAEVSSEDCLVFPPIQAAVVGTTFNVFNDDKTLHKFAFTRADTHDTLTVMEFFNVGQVVASEKLAKTSGIVEIRCAQHPWTHGYIAVFDHPYFDVTDGAGKFTIDSIPPGTYTVMVWEDGMDKPEPHRVQIAAGGSATLDLPARAADRIRQVSSARSTTIAAKSSAR